ncbi:hypothetical protein N7G274_008160 [Stereocaulon virgatum]|uniref:MOZ protein represents a chromatin-associated acetyltransferase n=1 Tax=Stereocaulon virgatum TaxID=373712 RepID=A0ABR4A2E3_9LECA
MSIPRLIFLYPHLFKPVRVRDTAVALQPLRSRPRRLHKAGFSTTHQHKQETYAKRYGPATEPQPPPSGSQMPEKPQNDNTLAGAIEKEVQSPTKSEEQKQSDAPPKKEPDKTASGKKDNDKLDSSRDGAIDATPKDPANRANDLDAAESHPKQTMDVESALKNNEGVRKAKPLETVLQMGPPMMENHDEHKAPHLHAPPYVHHFDTYGLVKDLENGGFTEDQSVTMMKAIRGLLAVNLDVAKEGLVSKSDVENENYLFRAACSELRTEILNTRKSSSTKTRTQLSHLQHTYDILSQRTTQETQALKDDLRGMLNDRRMAVRMQQQARDSEISELNYKISVRLNSDSKSEVEGLRWVLTRRAAMGIATMALLILGTLRYSSYKVHERELEARKKGSSGGTSSNSSSSGSAGSFTVPSRDMATQTGDGGRDAGVGVGSDKAENVGYVSLG